MNKINDPAGLSAGNGLNNTDGEVRADNFLDAFRRGEEAAFERLVEEHKDRLFFSALKMLRCKEDAEDAVATAFAAAYKERAKFRGTSSVYTWLWRICFNVCWHHLHKKRVAAFSIDEMTADGDEGASKDLARFVIADSARKDFFRDIEVSRVRKAVRRAILSLPKKYRRIVILRDLMDYSYEEIAVILDVSRGTVMSRLWRARESLRDVLVSAGVVGDEDIVASQRGSHPNAATLPNAGARGSEERAASGPAASSEHPAPRFRLPAAENL